MRGFQLPSETQAEGKRPGVLAGHAWAALGVKAVARLVAGLGWWWTRSRRRAGAAGRTLVRAVPLALDLLALAFLAATSIGFYWDGITLGRLHFEADTTDFYYPFLFRFDRALERGVPPFWAPEIFAGYPLYADGETGVFSPIHFLAVQFLSPVSALLWGRVAKTMLAAWFSYSYGRAIGLTRLGSVVVGLVFSLGSFLIVQLHHANVTNTAIWLPLILCFVELAVRSGGLRRHALLLGAGVALGAAALGLHVQILLMILSLVTAYIVFRCLWGPFGPPPAAAVTPAPSPLSSGLALSFGTATVTIPRAALRLVQAWLWVGGACLGGLLGLTRRLIVTVYALMVVLGVGLSLSMVQLLPLWELGSQAVRGNNLGFGFASSYSMTPHQLINLLFPYFFRTADRQWWTLWAEWESTLYIGVAPLLLVILATLLVRSRYTVFFLASGSLAVIAALGAYAPFDLYRYVWELPGFNLMRAPGRFTFLAVFSGAVLAGLGADWLDRYIMGREPFHWRSRFAQRLVAAIRPAGMGLYLLLAVVLFAAVMWAVAAGRNWTQEHQQTVLDWAQKTYLTQPKSRLAITPQLVYDGLLQSLDVRQLRPLVGLGLLAGTVGLLAALAAARSLAPLWRGALVLLIAGDLFFFARGFHPMIWREELEQPKTFVSSRPLAVQEEMERPKTFVSYLGNGRGLFRAYGDPWPQEARPNRLLPWGVSIVNGYTSLTPVRHQDYLGMLRPAEHTLLSLAGVRYLVRPARFTALPSVQSTSYYPGRPLLQGAPANPNANGTFRLPPMRTDSLRLVAGMEGALELPDGTPIAEVTVYGADGQRETATVRAGTHIADQAAEVPELAGRLRHQRARTVAFRDVREDPWFFRYQAAVSYAEIPLARTVVKPTRVEFRTVLPQGRLGVYGLALHSRQPSDEHQVMPEDEERYRLVYEDTQIRIYEYSGALPRAFLAAASRLVSPERSTLRLMAEGAFDPRRTVWLEGASADTEQPDGPSASQAKAEDASLPAGRAEILSYAALRVDIEADAARPGYLVLTDSFYPGWTAYVDGIATPIYRADYLYRAVPLSPGQHRVQFVFEPASVVAGGRLSLGVAGLILFFFLMFGLIRLARPVDRLLGAGLHWSAPRMVRAAARLRTALRKRPLHRVVISE